MKTKTAFVIGFALIFPVLIASAASNPECKSEEHYPLISKQELAKVAAEKAAFIVDVNSKDSFAEAHVPTAINYGANERNFAKMLPADKNALIVAYCGGVTCSAWKKAAERACNMGYTNIKHFKEGIAGWKQGQPGAMQ